MKKNNLSKLYLMVITLPKGKKEIIGDMLERFDVNAYTHTLAKGTYETKLSKDVMFCLIKGENIKDAILAIEDKFTKFRNNTSMVYTIPLYNIIGVSSYMALSNGGKKYGG